MATDLTPLTEAVTKTTGVEDSAVVFIQGLAQKIEQLKTDPIALQGLADTLNAKAQALADAIAAVPA